MRWTIEKRIAIAMSTLAYYSSNITNSEQVGDKLGAKKWQERTNRQAKKLAALEALR